MQTQQMLDRYREIYEILLEAAKSGKVCPPHAEIGKQFKPEISVAQVNSGVNYLRLTGQIKTRRKGNSNVVTIEDWTTAEPVNKPRAVQRTGNNAHMVKELAAQGMTTAQIATRLRIHYTTALRLQKELGLSPVADAPSKWQKSKENTDADLYGALAMDVLALRKRYIPVCKSETMGYPRGRYVVGSRLVDADQIPAMAARVRQEIAAAAYSMD